MHKDNEIVEMAHGGITKEIAQHLVTVSDWDNRVNIANKHIALKFTLEDIFSFKRYINEMGHTYKNREDYSKFETYNAQNDGILALLGGQGTGKTTAIVKALKNTKKTVLHLFYNKYPATQNIDVYSNGKQLVGNNKVVKTIDSMIYSLYRTREVGRPNYDNLRKACINNIGNLVDYINSFDVVVLDEIQSVNGYNRQIVLEILNNHKNVIMVGDFNQEWKKNYRNKTPFSMNDILKYTNNIYKLDINYRNSLSVYNYGKKILDDNTTSGALSKGRSMLMKLTKESELQQIIDEYRFEENSVIVSRHSKVRDKLYKKFNIKAKSVSDTKSTSPETVVLINSTKVGLHEKVNKDKEYDAVKEIWSAIMRPRTNLIIIEYEGWS